MKLCAYGRHIEIHRDGQSWRTFDIGTEGKKRPARDIQIPPGVSSDELATYIGDLLHEYATARHPEVIVQESE